MSFPVTEHIAKREHGNVCGRQSYSFDKQQELFQGHREPYMSDYQPLHTRRMLLTLHPTSPRQTSPFREIVPHYLYN